MLGFLSLNASYLTKVFDSFTKSEATKTSFLVKHLQHSGQSPCCCTIILCRTTFVFITSRCLICSVVRHQCRLQVVSLAFNIVRLSEVFVGDVAFFSPSTRNCCLSHHTLWSMIQQTYSFQFYWKPYSNLKTQNIFSMKIHTHQVPTSVFCEGISITLLSLLLNVL